MGSWDFMYPRGYRPRTRSGGRHPHKKNLCLECKADIGTPTIGGPGGRKVQLRYCQKHYCARILANGTICSDKNNGRSAYCDHHGRCQATGDEGRCWRLVQEDNPVKFKWCKEHGCAYPTCDARRSDPNNPHCRDHRCAKKTCDKPRLLDMYSSFCEKHTCEAGSCTAEVDGKGGDRGDAGGAAARFCDNHRRCAADDCARRCHTRDSLVVARYCGAHYCRANDSCDKPRSPASGEGYCAAHLCEEPGCSRPRADLLPGGGDEARFCAEHECKADACRMRRAHRARDAEYCWVHLCCVPRCTKPARAGDPRDDEGASRCEDHRRCHVGGCREWVYIEKGADGDVRHVECEKHHLPRCQANTFIGAQCDKRIPTPRTTTDHDGAAENNNNNSNNTRYCADHSCGFRSCPNPRPPESLQYCAAHKCGSGACQELVKNAVPALADAPSLRARLLLLAAAAGGGAGLGGVGDGLAFSSLGGGGAGRFCAAHSCLGDGGRCGGEVGGGCEADGRSGGGMGRRMAKGDEVMRFCVRHECAHRGCRAEATHQSRRSSRGGMCDRHYRRRRDGGGGGGGGGGAGGPFGPMGMPMPMGPMGMGFPSFFGGPAYDSSESSSDSDDGGWPRGLPFGGPFF